MRKWIFYLFFCLVSTNTFSQENAVNTPEYWKAQIQTNPKNAYSFLNLGIAYQWQGDDKNALQAYKRVIQMKSSLSPVAYYYAATVFKNRGQIDRAKNLLTKIDLDKIPKNIKKRVLLFKNTLLLSPDEAPPIDNDSIEEEEYEEESEEKKYSIYLEGSYGKNDNPAYATSSSQSYPQGKIVGVFSYQLSAEDDYEIKGSYTYSNTFFSGYKSANSSYHDLTLPYAYYLSDVRFRLIPEYISTDYGGERYSTSYGAAGDLAYKWDDYYFTFYTQLLALKPADTETYYYLEGSSQIYKASLSVQFELSKLTGSLSYNRYNYDDTDSITSSYGSPTLALTYDLYYGDFDLSFYTSYEPKTYKTDSDGATRKDKLNSYSLQGGWAINSSIRLFAEYAYSKNASTDSDYVYQQKTLVAGLSTGF